MPIGEARRPSVEAVKSDRRRGLARLHYGELVPRRLENGRIVAGAGWSGQGKGTARGGSLAGVPQKRPPRLAFIQSILHKSPKR